MALATLTIDINARLASIEKDMGRAAQIAERNAKRMQEAFTGVTAALGTLGGVLSAGMLAGWVKQAVDFADALDQLSERTGVSVESLNGLSYAVQLSGGDMEALEKGLQSLNKKLSEFSAGDKSTVELFNALGISATDAEGALLQLADVFPQLEKTDQVRAGTELLGKAYASLVPLLAQGRAGLQGLIEEGQKLNPITAENAKQAAAFNDNLDRLRLVSTSLAQQIGNVVIPALNQLAEEFLRTQKAGLSFWQALKGTIFEGLDDPTVTAGGKIKKFAAELADVEKQLASRTGASFGGESMTRDLEKRAETLRKYIALQKDVQASEALSGGDGYQSPLDRLASGGGQKITLPKIGGSIKPAKAPRAAKEKDYEPLAEAAKVYEKALSELVKAQAEAETSGLGLTKTQTRLMEVMMSPEWLMMPDSWRASVAAQGEATITLEKFAAEQKRLNELLTDSGLEQQRADMALLAKAFETGQISAEKYVEAVQRALGNVDVKPVEDQFADLKRAIEGFGQDAAAAIVDFALTGKMSFSDMTESILADIARMLVYQNITGPISRAVGGFDFAGFIGDMFGGARATGGPVSSGKTYLVGEKGPELLTMGGNGYVTPNHAIGGGTVVNVQVQNNAGQVAQATATATTDSTGNTQIMVIIEQIEGKMARRIQQGGGLAPTLEGRYGLNPAAGARW